MERADNMKSLGCFTISEWGLREETENLRGFFWSVKNHKNVLYTSL